MAQFYFRTRDEWIADGLLCADPCSHIDCSASRIQLTYPCPLCNGSIEGTAVFSHEDRFAHVTCVMKEAT